MTVRAIFKPPKELERHYKFDYNDTSALADGIFVAMVWRSWYKAGNPQGDEVNLVFVDNEPLGYWLRKLEEQESKVR